MPPRPSSGRALVFTLNVLDVELVDLAGEVVLLDGLGAGNRERKTPFKVLHLVHGATEQALERGRERESLKGREMNRTFQVRKINKQQSCMWV